MKQFILIHGSPEIGEIVTQESINPGWFLWLQKLLPNVIIPPMPLEVEVAYQDWINVFEQLKINKETILVGHSCGGGFLIRYLSEHVELKPAKVILVAPWLDPDGELTTDFMKFEINSEFSQKTELHIFISSDDMSSVVKSSEILKEKLSGATWHEFSDREHFCTKEFPELLEVLK